MVIFSMFANLKSFALQSPCTNAIAESRRNLNYLLVADISSTLNNNALALKPDGSVSGHR